jgi:hypothetical protein
MLKEDAIEKLVKAEVKRQVELQVSQAISSTEWIDELENKIVDFVQKRITARFSNIQTVPDLVDTVKTSVQDLFEQGFVPNIENLVDSTLLTQAVDQAVENLVSGSVESLLSNQTWVEKIQKQISRETTERLSRAFKDIDIKHKIRDVLVENRELLAGDLNRELEFADGVVAVKGHLNSDTIGSTGGADIGGDSTIHGSLVVDRDLVIKGRIATDNRAFRELGTSIKEQALDELKLGFVESVSDTLKADISKGITINNVEVNGAPLVNGNSLGLGIKNSSLESVGTLRSLKVGTTLNADNTRVGINTSSPTAALSIWDNEISVDIGKRSLNTAQIGTTKAQDLVVITNNKEQLKVDKNGTTWINELILGRNRISHGTETPGYSGAKGDLVFNTAYVPGGTFAWLCLGAFRWHELKSA